MKNKLFSNLAKDLPASVVVFLIAVPLCLGIAQASNPAGLDLVKPLAGIVAGIVGGIVIGILSGASLSVSGPAAGLTAVVAAGVNDLGTFELFLLATVVAGVLQIIMGYAKAGVLGSYVPNSVIKGMLSAIGIILILRQAPKLVGWNKDPEGNQTFIQADGENIFSEILRLLNHISPVALLIGALGIGILMIYELKAVKKIKLLQFIPGPLIVVILGVLINEYFLKQGNRFALNQEHLVQLPKLSSPGEIFSVIQTPDWSGITNYKVWVQGLTIALVASLETLLGVEAVDKLDPEKRNTPTNRELKAQGVGNAVSGLLGGLPLTSVIVRSSANVNSGAKSKMSTIIHGCFLLIALLFFATLMNKIPNAALAAVLIFTGYKLARISLFVEMYKKGWTQFIPFVVTIVAINLTDLLKGVLIGIIVGLYYVIRSNFKTATNFEKQGNNYNIQLKKEVSFLNKLEIKQELESIPDGANVEIDTLNADFIDQDVQEEIKEFLDSAKDRNINVSLKVANDKNFIFK